MASIATLSVSLVAKTGKFTSNMRRARRPVRNFSKGIDAASRRLRRFVGLLSVAAAGGGLVLLAKNAFTAVDALAKTSDKLGIATEDLAGLGIAAERSGVPIAQLQMGIQRMTRRMSEAARDTGEAKAAIKELELEAKALNQLSPDKQFLEIARAMEKVTNQADRVRLGFKLFDSEGVALINTLALGSKGLQQAFRDAERFGLAISRVDAKQVEMANDAIKDLQNLIKGVTFQVARLSAPFLEGMVDKIVEAGSEGSGMGDKIEEAARQAHSGIVQLLGVVDNLLGKFGTLSVASKSFMVGMQSGAGAVNTVIGQWLKGIDRIERFFQRWADAHIMPRPVRQGITDARLLSDAAFDAAEKSFAAARKILDEIKATPKPEFAAKFTEFTKKITAASRTRARAEIRTTQELQAQAKVLEKIGNFGQGKFAFQAFNGIIAQQRAALVTQKQSPQQSASGAPPAALKESFAAAMRSVGFGTAKPMTVRDQQVKRTNELLGQLVDQGLSAVALAG